MERPNIKDYFAEKADVKTVHNEYINSPHLYSYASALDRYVDYLEDKSNKQILPPMDIREELNYTIVGLCPSCKEEISRNGIFNNHECKKQIYIMGCDPYKD